jgi:protein-S-isoprenylcysteine O-methyltransferase Ste14
MLERTASNVARIGGLLFRWRTALPLPIVAVLLVVPSDVDRPMLLWAGAALVACGELVRLWSVRHIGVISRTRSDRLGPLVSSGPFRLIRNPLYIGNLLLWTGFTVSAQLLWWVFLVAALLALEYHAIVQWEETLLRARFGDEYRAYAARVPRWIPSLRSGPRTSPVEPRTPPAPYSWAETLFSERGTLIGIAVGYLLLWLKATPRAGGIG